MTNIVTNLLKITDYPFAYSLIGIVLLVNGRAITWEDMSPSDFAPLLTLIGLLATTLSISDPFGNLFRFIIRILGYRGYRIYPLRINATVSRFMEFLSHRYSFFSRSATVLATKWVTVEVDKIVSTVYFLLILVAILLAIDSQAFINNLNRVFSENNNRTILANQTSSTIINYGCPDDKCALIDENTKGILKILIQIAIAGIAIVVGFSLARLFRRTQIILVYFYVREELIAMIKEYKPPQEVPQEVAMVQSELKNAKSDLDSSQTELSKYLDSRDWGLAELVASSLAGLVLRLDRRFHFYEPPKIPK